MKEGWREAPGWFGCPANRNVCQPPKRHSSLPQYRKALKPLFGTDGIRARAGQSPLDAATLPAVGQAIGLELAGEIIVGQDPRASSPWILERLKEGLDKTNASIVDVGVLPTPAIALLTQQTDAAGGVMISASHNCYQDNGIKIFGPNGRKLADEEEEGLEERVRGLLPTGGPDRPLSEVPSATPRFSASSWLEQYEALLAARFPDGSWLQGVRLVVDCANGAMAGVAPDLFRRMGAEVSTINASPSGTNINDGCGAVHPQSLIEAVRRRRADLGVAFDGDGDRSMFVAGSGKLVDGDAILLLIARLMKKEGQLDPPTVIGTSMSNYSLERVFADEDIRLIRTGVGDRHVFQKMLESGSVLGGEPSGHIIFPDFQLSGDGLLTTLKVCDALVKQNASLDDLTADWDPAPQLLENVPVERKVPLEAMPSVHTRIDEIARELEGRGRIVVRYSGTESLLRVMIESDSAPRNEQLAGELIALVRRELPKYPKRTEARDKNSD